jgi:hypothetical protein
VAIGNGEDGYQCLFKQKIKLYRFRDQEWKSRGGFCFLRVQRHVETRKIRVLVREESNMKIRANFWIQEDAKLKPHGDKGTSYSWHAYDSSEDPPTID